MNIFKRNKEQDKKDILDYLPIEQKASFEIKAHKDAKHEVQQEAKEATRFVNDLLERNGFTVSIVVGAVGKPKLKQRTR